MKTGSFHYIETHPFKIFAPDDMRYLILGSFPGKDQTVAGSSGEHWFYGAKRNTFWKILQQVYDIPLQSKKAKQDLFIATRMGIGDIILKAVRREGTNSDSNLEIIEFNTAAITNMLNTRDITTVFCTGKFVERLFKKLFPGASHTIVLPSPSPRFATMTLAAKAGVYKKYLPALGT